MMATSSNAQSHVGIPDARSAGEEAPTSYEARRRELQEYFDRTAVDAWARLTSTEPVSGIRATVRAGRDRMRSTLLGFLPEDLTGQRVLDAGCGTGSLAVEAAMRGASVVAIDLSPTLINLAHERFLDVVVESPALRRSAGSVEFLVSDMCNPALGRFDWVIAMDSLIHYQPSDMAEMIVNLSQRADRGMAFTFAPRTALLALMHMVGRIFPRGNRAPDLEPIAESTLRALLEGHPAMQPFEIARCEHVETTFYMSTAMELVRR